MYHFDICICSYICLYSFVRYHTFFKELGDLRSQLRAAESSPKPTDRDPAEDDRTDEKRKIRTLTTRRLFLDGSEDVARRPLTAYSLKILEDAVSSENALSDRRAYCAVASRVRSVIGFVKVAYPDMIGGESASDRAEPLNVKDRKICRAKLLTCVERGLYAATAAGVTGRQETVYDLDALAARSCSDEQRRFLGNRDEERIGRRSPDGAKQLRFESRFESGNLRRAIQVNDSAFYAIDYELYVSRGHGVP